MLLNAGGFSNFRMAPQYITLGVWTSPAGKLRCRCDGNSRHVGKKRSKILIGGRSPAGVWLFGKWVLLCYMARKTIEQSGKWMCCVIEAEGLFWGGVLHKQTLSVISVPSWGTQRARTQVGAPSYLVPSSVPSGLEPWPVFPRMLSGAWQRRRYEKWKPSSQLGGWYESTFPFHTRAIWNTGGRIIRYSLIIEIFPFEDVIIWRSETLWQPLSL